EAAVRAASLAGASTSAGAVSATVSAGASAGASSERPQAASRAARATDRQAARVITLLRRDRVAGEGRLARPVLADAILDLVAEVPDQTLHRPGGGVAEGADGVALDLGRDFQQQVDLGRVGLADRHALEHPPHPAGALAARGALAAAFMLVEV